MSLLGVFGETLIILTTEHVRMTLPRLQSTSNGVYHDESLGDDTAKLKVATWPVCCVSVERKVL